MNLHDKLAVMAARSAELERVVELHEATQRIHTRAEERIAELEADNSRYRESLAGAANCLGQLRSDLSIVDDIIARAIAELEKLAPDEYDLTYAQLVNGRARAILKGEA